MESTHDTDGAPLIPHEEILSNRAEYSPLETSADSSNDLGERLKNLPIELKQKIICSLTPKKRRHLRLVNKAMLDAVDASMSDVQEIEIRRNEFNREWRDDHAVHMTTINPYNGAKKTHFSRTACSSLPFLLKWAGVQLKTLVLIRCSYMSEYDGSHLMLFYRVLEALNSENTCPKLTNLSFHMDVCLWNDCEIILNELLKYVTKRQLQAKAADHPIPFLHSLLLIDPLGYTPCETFPVDPVDSEKRRKFLQDLLDQCHGLKNLDVESLLVQENLPIVSLRYPTTLTCLNSERLGISYEDLPTIIDNCPNLQIINLAVGFPRDDAEVHALASLSDLRKLELVVNLTEDDVVWKFAQCLAAFEDHPFGASIARPWPQLQSITVNCYRYNEDNESLDYRLLLSGADCSITSLHLTRFKCWDNSPYAQSVEKLFKVLNCKDACPNLLELNINSCEHVYHITESLVMPEDRGSNAFSYWCENGVNEGVDMSIPGPHVYGILNDLLAYVTKRQSAVRLGKPFLRSLSIGKDDCRHHEYFYAPDYVPGPHDQLEQIHTTVQQILDQCNGLEDLYMESLEDYRINPNKKRGRELMELVALRFPKTLKKLNGVSLD